MSGPTSRNCVWPQNAIVKSNSRRVFEIEITLCPFCCGQVRVIADVTDPDLIRKILDHAQQRTTTAAATTR